MTPHDLLFTADGRESLRDLLFTFDGRIGRGKFWLAYLAWISVFILLAILFFLTGWIPALPYLLICVAFIASVLMLISSIAVGIKRLHDRGKSGWWLLLFELGPGLLSMIGTMAGSMGAVFNLASLAIGIWMFVELGCLRGTAGPNQYGPDPLAASAGQPASI